MMSRVLAIQKSLQLINRGFLSKSLLIGSSFIGYAHFFKHTFLLEYYKKLINLHGKDGPIEPSERLKKLFCEVSEEVKEFTSEYTPIVPIITPGLNVLHAGTVGTHFGGFVGLPIIFEFCNEEDVSNGLMINGHSADEDYTDDFLLSNSAKKFEIAHEILQINTSQVYLYAVLPFTVNFTMDAVSRNLANNLGLINFPLYIRCLFYVAITITGLGLWRFLYVNIRNYYESEVQMIITKLNSEYINGGIEYYSKVMIMNSVRAELKDQSGKFLKTVGDSIRSIISYNEIPLSHRIAYLKAHLNAESKVLDL